jgi:predicted esterase
MPVNTNGKNLAAYSKQLILDIIHEVNEMYKTTDKWLVSGTSNGGEAAFNFVAAQPDRFEALFVVPGIISDSINISKEWSHLSVVMAYGELDDEKVIKPTKLTAKKIKKNVANFELLNLEGQGHILGISFNIDRIYDTYFIAFKN